MSSPISVYTKYVTGSDFGGGLQVKKLIVKKAGWKTNPRRLYIGFEGEGSIKKAWIYLEPETAIPLAKNILNITEGYASNSETEIA